MREWSPSGRVLRRENAAAPLGVAREGVGDVTEGRQECDPDHRAPPTGGPDDEYRDEQLERQQRLQ